MKIKNKKTAEYWGRPLSFSLARAYVLSPVLCMQPICYEYWAASASWADSVESGNRSSCLPQAAAMLGPSRACSGPAALAGLAWSIGFSLHGPATQQA